MFNQEIFRDALAAYKRDFNAFQWKNERFKWEAVQHFQENWDIHAEDLPGMLKRSFEKTYGLLASMGNFPKQMIIQFAAAAPETVRAAFVYLFDESKELIERIKYFKDQAEMLLAEYGNGARQHFQNENSISTYLWLRYPDKYYIYKYSEVRSVSKLLCSSYAIKKGYYMANLRNSISLYDEICAELQKDGELRSMLDANLEEGCYPDPQLRTMAIDIGFYISNYYSEQVEKTTYLSEIIEALKALGGKAHLNDIGAEIKKRGKLPSIHTNLTWENSVRATIYRHFSGNESYIEGTPDLFYPVEGLGQGIWGLRESETPPKSNHDNYAPNLTVENWLALINDPEVFNQDSLIIMRRMLDIGGEATCIQLSEKYGDSWNYYNRGSSALAQRIAKKADCAIENPEDPNSRWWPILYTGRTANAEEHGSFVWKLRDELKAALEQTDLSMVPLYSTRNELEAYDRAKFLQQVYMSGENFDTLCALLRHKKNVILQGAPGVGKTFAAKRLAYAMMGVKDESRIEFVQFHQNYSYEDFIMGYKPTDEGFKLTEGIFYTFCKRAATDKDQDFFFIIDEINRGNMSKIFGELLMLIEKDYRNMPATLAYSKEKFSVPDNVYIIGMMNTADRSLAMIDYALRRRFSFFEMDPAFDTEGFGAYQSGLNSEIFDSLIDCIRDLNRDIRKDASLGSGFCIGHSYFCNQTECIEEWMKAVVYYDILPMLREYWFDDFSKVDRWESRLSGVFE